MYRRQVYNIALAVRGLCAANIDVALVSRQSRWINVAFHSFVEATPDKNGEYQDQEIYPGPFSSVVLTALAGRRVYLERGDQIVIPQVSDDIAYFDQRLHVYPLETFAK